MVGEIVIILLAQGTGNSLSKKSGDFLGVAGAAASMRSRMRKRAGLEKLSKMKRLSELEPGTVARIHSFEKNDLFLKLMEMGCVPGELIRVEQIAPLGDPISITVAGYNLSLRLDEADNIFMEEEVQ